MLCCELFETALYDDIQVVHAPKQGPVEVGNTTAIINPSPHDMAKMFAQTRTEPMRALTEPGRFVVWPAEDALHQVVQIALRMDRRARRFFVYANTHDDRRATSKIGRYYVWVGDDMHGIVKPLNMGPQMKAALAIPAERSYYY